jgi:hypothetical protein
LLIVEILKGIIWYAYFQEYWNTYIKTQSPFKQSSVRLTENAKIHIFISNFFNFI